MVREPRTEWFEGQFFAMIFHYVYVLYSLNHKFIYVGYTRDLRGRFQKHNKKEVKSTSHYVPLELIFYEAYQSIEDALRRERHLKTTKGRMTLKSMLRETLLKKQNRLL